MRRAARHKLNELLKERSVWTPQNRHQLSTLYHKHRRSKLMREHQWHPPRPAERERRQRGRNVDISNDCLCSISSLDGLILLWRNAADRLPTHS